MGEISEAAIAGTMVLEELDGGGAAGGGDEASAPEPENLRCRSCALWPRPQTWLCVVPLLIGFIGLGLSLMLLKWIVVGSVQDYVPTDLVNSKGMEQDPIFLSKPSAVPKNPHTTPSSGSLPTVRPHHRPGAPASAAPTLAPSPRSPHLHNRISTRLTTTTVRPPHPPGRDVPPRSTTVRRNGPANGRNGPPSSTRVAPPSSSPSPSRHPVLRGTARTLNRERSSKGMPLPPTRPHLHARTVAPTSPSLPSEHFKPCKDKDLTYCLNEGECFLIQTLTGLNKHCRCKEGFQGIRCDQFLPKTDSMLSYPAEHLGIEFMEGKDTYRREILTVSCITIGISLLGTFCMALYCQNKRRREKLRAHLMVSCSLETPNMALDPVLTDESRSRMSVKSGPKVQEHCKDPGSSPPHEDAACCSGFPQNCQAPPSYPKAPPTKKKSRSRSLSCSPGQRNRVFHYQTTPRRSQPISRGRLNAIGALRDSGHSYQHLQEVEDSEKVVQSLRVCNFSDSGSPGFHNGNLNLPRGDGGADWRRDTGVHSNRLEHSTPLHQSLRTCSVPIIPSFQEQDFTSCVLEKTFRECEKSNPQGMFPHVASAKTGYSGLWRSQEEGSAEVFWTLPHASGKEQDSYDKFLAPAGGGASGEAQNKLHDRELKDMSGHADHSIDYSQPYQSKKNSDNTAHMEGTRQ